MSPSGSTRGSEAEGPGAAPHETGRRSAARGPGPEGVAADLHELESRLTRCRRCPRLVSWREKVAREKRLSFADETYWGRPVPGFGDPGARILVVGLAPAAHGANRTGRMFTGDRSGDWLFRALFRAGLANRPEAIARDDGLELTDVFITAAVRCAPPANKPTTAERDTCRPWLEGELDLLGRLKVVVTLGGFAYAHTLRILAARGFAPPTPRPRFGHGVEVPLSGGPIVLASYHPSQQNTFTGTLTEEMFGRVWARARSLAGS